MTAAADALITRVLGPLRFAEAERLVRAAGWAPACRDADDPETLGFRGARGLVWLTRDAATGNVLLTGAAGDLPAHLPRPATAEILALLTSGEAREALAGLQLARQHPDPALRAPAALLLVHPEPVVAEAARDWLAGWIAGGGFLGSADIAGALFSLPGWRREKLQTMRWWMRDRPADPLRLAGALARALADPDWELAATAMLTAATLGLTGLAPRIRRVALPGAARDGVTGAEARLLLALRDAGLTRLGAPAGKALPPGVMAVLDGDPDGLPPGLRHFAAALALPLPIGMPPPDAPGVVVGAAGPMLGDGTLLAWVPPGTYRLGTTTPARAAAPNPPRRVVLDRGFYLDAEPRAAVPFAAARAEAARLGGALPTPAMWEMAVRGADGRTFPWGLNARTPVDLSPHGLAGLLDGPGEWLDPGPHAAPLVAGGARSPVPAHHRPAPPHESRGYRLVIVP